MRSGLRSARLCAAPPLVPTEPIQALRELMQARKQLGREVTVHSQRIEKVLSSLMAI
jgi:transposase